MVEEDKTFVVELSEMYEAVAQAEGEGEVIEVFISLHIVSCFCSFIGFFNSNLTVIKQRADNEPSSLFVL